MTGNILTKFEKNLLSRVFQGMTLIACIVSKLLRNALQRKVNMVDSSSYWDVRVIECQLLKISTSQKELKRNVPIDQF